MLEKAVVKMTEDSKQSKVTGENVALLSPVNPYRLLRRFRNTHRCVSSKAAVLILVSSFPVSLMCMLLLYPHTYKYFSMDINFQYSNISSSFLSAVIYCFYPLAGHLADVKFGRYKTVVSSLWMLLVGLLLLPPGAVSVILVVSYGHGHSLIPALVIGSIILAVGCALLVVSFIGFKANVIQYGLDQLYDTPTEEQSIYIHWYVWTCYLALFTKDAIVIPTSIQEKFSHWLYVLGGSIYVGIVVISIVCLCLINMKRNSFNIEPSRVNPYRLVLKVSQFAHQHKVPVKRSSFTYCEDEVPSGLDLGKHKYGGPFTIEQVEDVKAFYGILKVLFSLGPIFILRFAANPALSFISSEDIIPNHNNFTKPIHLLEVVLFGGNVLYPFLIVCCIPIHIFIVRPFISYYVAGILKRLGIGITILLLSLIYSFSIETVSHSENKELGCIFDKLGGTNVTASSVEEEKLADAKIFLVFLQSILLGFSHMLIYISIYEFICSQSPHPMKGLVIGVFFAIEGVFNFLGSAIMLPFSLYWHSSTLPSCGMTYYLVHMCIGLVALVIYIGVARSYKYRVRDEPCHVQRYVEEYYSKLTDEANT